MMETHKEKCAHHHLSAGQIVCRERKQLGGPPDRPLAYGVVFLRLGGGLGCFSPAIDNYID
jgi:hypothetical protein